MKNKSLIFSGMMVTFGLAVSVSWAMASIDEALIEPAPMAQTTTATQTVATNETEAAIAAETPAPEAEPVVNEEVAASEPSAVQTEPEREPEPETQLEPALPKTVTPEPVTPVAETKAKSEFHEKSESKASSSYAS